jgi:hypothetical protein
MEKSITRKLTGRSGAFWRKVDQACEEVAAWPSWKRGYQIAEDTVTSRPVKIVRASPRVKVARKKAR